MPLARKSRLACFADRTAHTLPAVKSILSGASMSMTSERSTIFIARAE